jgi:hypothetical protein
MKTHMISAAGAASPHSVGRRSAIAAFVALGCAAGGGFAAHPARADQSATTASCTSGVWNQESANVLPAM